MSLRVKPPRNRSSTRRFPIGPTPKVLQISVADRTSGGFGVPANQFAFSERTGSLLTALVSAEKCPLPQSSLRTTDHLDRQTQFGGPARAYDVTDPDLRWVDLDRVAPILYCHVIHPRCCDHPTRHPAPRVDRQNGRRIRCTTTLQCDQRSRSSSKRANSRNAPGQAVPRSRAVGGHPAAKVARRWRTVANEPFVVSGGRLRCSARMTSTGNVIPPSVPPPWPDDAEREGTVHG